MPNPEPISPIIKRVMSKLEFQQHHGFCDEDMQRISDVKEIFNGTVTKIGDADDSKRVGRKTKTIR